MKSRVLITGSSGMLGADLCRELGRDYEVYGLDRVKGHPSTSLGTSGLRVKNFTECDITDKKEILSVIKKIKPDIVIHAAAWTDVDGCELDPAKAREINVKGTENVASACSQAGAALVYISTDFVFDGRKKGAYTEKDKPSPISVYGDSKLKGELAVKKLHKIYFILRTSWLYGKHGKNFVDTILAKASSGGDIKVVDDQIGSPTYSKDLAEAIKALLDKLNLQLKAYSLKLCGIYHVSNGGNISWYEYAKEILRLSGSNSKVLPISSARLDRPAKRPAMSVLDNSRFIRLTGYRMRGWRSALKEYLKER